MVRLTAIVLMVGVCAAAMAAPTTNSADLYGRAFEKIKADKGDLSAIDDVGKTPMNDATGKFLRDRADVVGMLRDAAKMSAADWASSNGDMPAVLKPLNSARSASSLLLLQARYDLHENNADQAVEDTLAAIAAGRNVARQRMFISTLVDVGIEWQAIDALAAELVVLPKQTVASLPAKLAALPQPLSGKELMDGEFAFGRQVWDKQNMPMPIFDAAKPFYKAVGDAMDQPQAKFEQTVDAEATKLMLNPVVKNIESTVKRIHVTLLGMTAKRSMLDTAIDVVLNGEGAVAKSKDPAGDGPFGFSGSATHFTLTSKAVDSRDKPVTLRVGG